MRLAQLWLVTFGVVCAGIGLVHLLFGSATIIGGGRVNATIDSDLRFYALLFTAFGVAFVWCAADLRARSTVVDVLGVVFFVGGLARLLSWAILGQPNWFYVLMAPVELVIPIVNHLLIRHALGDHRGRSLCATRRG